MQTDSGVWEKDNALYLCPMRRILADCIFPISSEPIKNGILLIDDEGTILGLLSPGMEGYEERLAERYDGWLIPGMINTHCHLELSHLFKAVPERIGLDGFVETLMKVRSASEATIQKAMQEADAYMWENGIVAVGDISNSSRSFSIKENSKIQYHTFIERFGLDESFAEKAFDSGIDLLNELKKNTRNSQGNLTPHAPYSVSKKLLKSICDHIDQTDGILSIHNQETATEDVFFQTGNGLMAERMQRMGINMSSFQVSGKSSLQTIRSSFPSDKKILLVHNTFSSEEDIQLAQAEFKKLFWCLCPGANLYIENQLPPIEILRKNNCRITLGTDSLASNHQLDILSEIRLINSAFPQISLNELFSWATLNGAELLGLERNLGSFQIGKKPGIVLIQFVDKFNGLILPESRASFI